MELKNIADSIQFVVDILKRGTKCKNINNLTLIFFRYKIQGNI